MRSKKKRGKKPVFFTVAQIAKELKIPESTVRYRLKVKKIKPAKVKTAIVRTYYSQAQVDKLAGSQFKPGRVAKKKA